MDRVLNGVDHAWQAPLGAWAEYRFAAPTPLHHARLVFDSDLNRPTTSNMPCCYPLDGAFVRPPAPLVRVTPFSTITTLAPLRAAPIAAQHPAMPPPSTRTSQWISFSLPYLTE
jgi:hypothetical protein